MKKIGIIGSGAVAKALGEGFVKYGYGVMLGTSDASKLEPWIKEKGINAQIGTFSEAAQFGDLIVLAVKGGAAKQAIEKSGIAHLANKIVIDATNPIDDAAPTQGVLKFFTSLEKSLMEELQEMAPEVRFVKAFNSVGSAFMVDPKFESKPTMFICGNDEAAKQEVSAILEQFGWEAADFGQAESARAIEPLCILWCIPGFLKGQWSHAFKLLKV